MRAEELERLEEREHNAVVLGRVQRHVDKEVAQRLLLVDFAWGEGGKRVRVRWRSLAPSPPLPIPGSCMT